MVSEVKGPASPTTRRADLNAPQGGQARAAEGGGAARANEVVTLTDLAARLQRLTDSVKDLPVVDQARVAEFRQALESGDYRMDERQIADKLASFEALFAKAR